jgi:hypothetical protein
VDDDFAVVFVVLLAVVLAKLVRAVVFVVLLMEVEIVLTDDLTVLLAGMTDDLTVLLAGTTELASGPAVTGVPAPPPITISAQFQNSSGYAADPQRGKDVGFPTIDTVAGSIQLFPVT